MAFSRLKKRIEKKKEPVGKTSDGSVPTNQELYSKIKSEAKAKFDRYPSAYSSSWIVKTYKDRGGSYRKGKE